MDVSMYVHLSAFSVFHFADSFRWRNDSHQEPNLLANDWGCHRLAAWLVQGTLDSFHERQHWLWN